jgi:LAO/AO transport system kinase
MTPQLEPADRELVDRALQRQKHAIASLVSLFEDQRASALERRAAIFEALSARTRARPAFVLGLTGTPGSGKSSLLSRVAPSLLQASGELSLAMLAVDPSSQVSGGALLGDRTRMRLPVNEPRVFFRSQASQVQLGGLGPWTFQVCRLLTQLFDCVIVETVGIGQSEADVRELADQVYLVLQPLGGDEVQFLKAGIMEIPDAFILNKSDEPSASRSYHALRTSLALARPFDADCVPLYRTSARTGAGIGELTAAIVETMNSAPRRPLSSKEPYFFERLVREEWGRFGVELLQSTLGGAERFLRTGGGFDRAQLEFGTRLKAALSDSTP